MPIVNLDLTEAEAERIDAIAATEKRSRRSQVHLFMLIGLAQYDEEQAAKSNPEPKEP